MAKKTVLNDDAGIYQKRNDRQDRPNFSEMSKQEKFQYFKDYYAKQVIFGTLILGFLIYILYTIIAPHDESLLYAAVINDDLEVTKKEQMIEKFGNLIQYNPSRQNMLFDDSFYLEADNIDLITQSKIATYTYAGSLDVIIADEDVYQYYVDQGYFFDLTQVLPSDTYSKLTDKLYMAKSTGNEDSSEKAYGIYLDSSKVYTDISANYQKVYSNEPKKMVVGIVQNTKNYDVCIEFVNYLFSK